MSKHIGFLQLKTNRTIDGEWYAVAHIPNSPSRCRGPFKSEADAISECSLWYPDLTKELRALGLEIRVN